MQGRAQPDFESTTMAEARDNCPAGQADFVKLVILSIRVA
jgi:hypothetical protein